MNLRAIGIAAVVVLIAASMCLFTVDEREYAIKFRFGEIIRTDYGPGLYVKLPWEDVRKYPRRILTITNPQELFLTLEKKNLLVDFFVKWRIVDQGAYYRASSGGDESLAASRLLEIVKDGIRGEFAQRTVPQVVSADRREFLEGILERARGSAAELGIEVVDVRVKRTEFPEQVSDSVFDRMRQERARVASELRAQGAEAAEQIRAEADRERVVILAEAYRDAEKIRGEGDAEATAIYAAAHQRDPEFFSFYRSLKAYRESIGRDNDLLVIDTDSEFFRYLERPGSSQR